jgi:hypothetical protein
LLTVRSPCQKKSQGLSQTPDMEVPTMSTKEPERVHTLLTMYDERYAELERVMAARTLLPAGPDAQRLFDRRSEQIEYLFGCLDGLRIAIHVIDPDRHFHGWRDWGTWETSLRETVRG